MKADGGSAFPWTNCETHGLSGGYGMSLRDYFAAKAMNGLLASCRDIDRQYTINDLVTDAYRYADAMLAERNKTDGSKT